ncbi:MAG: DMT family transporter [Gammaproteobacteria bacterium]|nr:DMT family transporter [Gammaproteobacteria bacterium]
MPIHMQRLILFIRMLATLGVFAGLIFIFRSPWPSLRGALHQLVVGTLIHTAYLGGVFAAIKWQMPAGVTSLLVGLQPLLTAVLAWSVLGDRLRGHQWLGLFLGLIGVSLVLLRGEELGQFDISMGALIAAVTALLGISIGTLYQKRFGVGINPFTGSFLQFLATAIWMGVFTLLFEQQIIVWHPQLIMSLLWLVFGLSVTAILLLMYMIREGESAKVASYFYLVPPVTALEAWWLFDETLSPESIAGILLTVLGVYLVLKNRK